MSLLNIGFYLKTIRQKKKLTLNDVAQGIDISASLLSQIENNKANPSITSLSAILNYYQINVSDFFKQMEKKEFVIAKVKDLEKINDKELGFSFSLLASKLEGNILESYLFEVNPNRELDIFKIVKEENYERVIVVLSGQLEIDIAGEICQLYDMDSINYKAHLKVILRNKSLSETTKFFLSGNPPII